MDHTLTVEEIRGYYNRAVGMLDALRAQQRTIREQGPRSSAARSLRLAAWGAACEATSIPLRPFLDGDCGRSFAAIRPRLAAAAGAVDDILTDSRPREDRERWDGTPCIDRLAAALDTLRAALDDAEGRGSRAPRRPNDERDRFIYERMCEGAPYKTILAEVNRRPGWAKLGKEQGVEQAGRRYARRMGLDPPPRRRGGRSGSTRAVESR